MFLSLSIDFFQKEGGFKSVCLVKKEILFILENNKFKTSLEKQTLICQDKLQEPTLW